MEWPQLIASLIAAALTGGGVTSLTTFLLNKQKQDDKHELDVGDHATKVFEGQIALLVQRIVTVERAEAECSKARTEDARKAGYLEGRVEQQSQQLNSQTGMIAEQNTRIAEQSARIKQLQTELEKHTRQAA